MAQRISATASLAIAQRPLFRGYALVAFACAWLVGDWLSGQGALALVAPPVWLGLAGAGLTASGGVALGSRRMPTPRAQDHRWLHRDRETRAGCP